MVSDSCCTFSLPGLLGGNAEWNVGLGKVLWWDLPLQGTLLFHHLFSKNENGILVILLLQLLKLKKKKKSFAEVLGSLKYLPVV